jgi:hypothetical protein
VGHIERRAVLIVKLLPEQIAYQWDSIRCGVINAIAPIVDPTPENIQEILCQLLKQDMQCWCVFEGDDIYGHILTSISIDINTNFRTLMIYSLFLFRKAPPEMWEEGWSAIEKFAESNKCTRISAYTKDENVMSIAEKRGFSPDYTYLVKDIGG